MTVDVKSCPVCGAPMQHPTVCIACGHELPPQRVGALVAGKYRILSRIGNGGMGEVYTAENVETRAPLAIKFLLGHSARVPEFRSRFRREAIALSRLRHPGIVSVVDFGDVDGDLFLAMELLRGVSLSDLLARREPPTLPRLIGIFDAVLGVLEFTHAAAIVHRDLKPENVMVVSAPGDAGREATGETSEQVKVLDFGLASVEEAEGAPRLTASGAVQGTPQYMSPEQCRGRRVGPPTDVYAVGIMLYEALAGALPFESEVMAGFMAQHMFVSPRPMREVGAHREVAPGLEQLVMRAIAKEAADRPTAGEMRLALHAAAKGTDAAGTEARVAKERMATAGLSREERALGRPAAAPTPAPQNAVATEPARRVVVWVTSEARARQLQDALAVNGLMATIATGNAPPSLEGISAVVLAADGSVMERAKTIRAASRDTCVFAVGATDALQIVQLIRAGVNDAAILGVGDDEVSRKVKRLVRRGR